MTASTVSHVFGRFRAGASPRGAIEIQRPGGLEGRGAANGSDTGSELAASMMGESSWNKGRLKPLPAPLKKRGGSAVTPVSRDALAGKLAALAASLAALAASLAALASASLLTSMLS
jgi:hypothetical protein